MTTNVQRVIACRLRFLQRNGAISFSEEGQGQHSNFGLIRIMGFL